MSELKELVAQRGRIKTRITLFEKYVKPLTESKLSKNQYNELTLRLTKFQDLSYSFDELQSKIESLDLADDHMSEREEVENRFFSLIAKTQDMLQTFDAKEKINHESSSASQMSHCSHHHQHLKLPTLKVPPFSGEPGKWLEFRDTYSSLIHDNDSIDNVSKFHYLKSYLEGTAKGVISSVTVSTANYPIAWSLLCDRFNNKRLLINEHIKCLFSLEPMVRESDRGLRGMIDAISKNISALNSLDEPTESWDSMIIYMASEKLDSETARDWEEHRSTLDKATLDNFFEFLRHRATVLETVRASKSHKCEKRNSLVKSKSFMASSSPESSQGLSHGASYGASHRNCLACKQNHKLYECMKFKTLPTEERILKVNEWKLCNNCLRGGHRSSQCRLGGCRICNKKHNTVLHRQSSLQTNTQQSQQGHEEPTSLLTTDHGSPSGSAASSSSSSSMPRQEGGDSSCVVSMSSVSFDQVLLSTAVVEVTINGKLFKLKALLDSGSQSSFITESALARIGFHKTKIQKRCVSGLSNTVINITEHCSLVIKSSYNSFSAPVTCYVIPLITDHLPHLEIRVQELGIPSHIQLADPNFYRPSDIDMLLGADIFWEVIGSSQIRLGPNHKALLRETQLGWIVAGPIGGKSSSKSNRIFCNFSQTIQQQLSKFWELEEVPVEIPKSYEHDFCENHFTKTTYRDEHGRFCVQLPLRDSPSALGESYHIAEKRLFQVERKLSRSPSLRTEYNKFMNEYERLGHMSEVTKPATGCYLPHHAVIKESSETTKLRVVFDASAETSSGVSLNDIQYVGPVVQDDLFSILLRFRQHRYVVSADVEKMYRQIKVNRLQRPLQMILWREKEDLPIKIFELNTVTYGTASAPFLSTRCLLQLAKECPDKKIAELIQNDFYIDDFLSGSGEEDELRHIINTVTQTLHSAGLPLRKFRTNAPSIVLNNPSSLIPKALDSTSLSSALGLRWDPAFDVLNFSTNIENPAQATKRTILSNSAKLFDPLGLLSPCTIIPKMILQKLWISNLHWDDPVPSDIETSWLDFVSNLVNLSSLKIPRYVLCSEPEVIEMHTFCDASEVAYGTCLYLRSIDKSGQVKSSLLCAKTKVAPLKPQTIPRLELCGAVLAARLSHKVLKALRLEIHNVYYWSDSTVVLGWLSSHARDLKTFVSNRVAEVQQLTSSGSWRHVPGTQNPADLASRGLDPKYINEATLWWHGPSFLLENEATWPSKIKLSKQLPEIKSNSNELIPKTNCIEIKSNSNELIPKTTTTTCTKATNIVHGDSYGVANFEKHSKLTTLQRSIAYVHRFIYNLRHANSKRNGHLTAEELEASLHYIIKQHQAECFGTEINLLKNKKCLPAKSGLLSLRPFVDETGVLRVGGRIQGSSETYNKIHPILLESKHNFTKLLFAHEHKKLLHCGPQLLITNIRQIYWPITGRRLARSTINNCKLCRVIKAKSIIPIMGNLPLPRVTPNLPFQVSGVDFAGPFPIRDRMGRGCKIIKSYLCVFVCFSTRALHLEIASDMSSEVFILCLKRFISRRGKPSEIYCDNGRNFVGANNDFSQILSNSNESVSSFAADEGISFKFSPAYTPHFGGLWEAGVKSAKHHLTRILGDNHLTYEELSTLFIQIEAILNSRPLCPLSSDPTDLFPLTPGHFLIGRPLTSLPTPALLDVKTNRLNRYQEIEQMRQHFWERWRKEFLSELQQRAKWRIKQGELLEGDMVILKEPNMPPLKWKMGRIHRLYPGPDGVSRVADVFTSKGIVRRAITNLSPLPMGNHLEDGSPRAPKVVERGEDVPAH